MSWAAAEGKSDRSPTVRPPPARRARRSATGRARHAAGTVEGLATAVDEQTLRVRRGTWEILFLLAELQQCSTEVERSVIRDWIEHARAERCRAERELYRLLEHARA